MRKFLGSAVIFIAITCGNTVMAVQHDYQPIFECSSAIKSEDLDLAKEYAGQMISLSPISGPARLRRAIECLDYAFGEGWRYNQTLNTLVNDNREINIFTAKILNEDQNAAYYRLVSDLAYLTEKAKKQLKAADERRKAVCKFNFFLWAKNRAFLVET